MSSQLAQREIEQLLLEVEALKSLVDELSECPSFGILTAPALRHRVSEIDSFPSLAAVYLDVDDMKEANSRYGHADVDRRIHAALTARSSDCVMGRWLQGDEIVAIVPWIDALGFCDRLLAAFQAQGMSCTIAVQRVGRFSVEEAIKQAGLLCHKTKMTSKGVVVVSST
jgi:predicted signal transduction protein with EAL and GGDEF domain